METHALAFLSDSESYSIISLQRKIFQVLFAVAGGSNMFEELDYAIGRIRPRRASKCLSSHPRSQSGYVNVPLSRP